MDDFDYNKKLDKKEDADKMESLEDVIKYNDHSDDEEMNEEVAKSMERLTEEQTKVAAASIGLELGGQKNKQRTDSNTVSNSSGIEKTQEVPNVNDCGKTVDLSDIHDAIKKNKDISYINSKQTNPTFAKEKSNVLKHPDNNSIKKKANKKSKKKLGMIIGAVAAIVVVIVIVVVSVVGNNNSYDYNLKKGRGLFQSQNYKDAETYLIKASEMEKGKNNVDLLMMLYHCYYNNDHNDNKNIESILKSVIALDRMNEDAVKGLAEYYTDNKDGEGLNYLIKEYKNTSEAGYISKYVVKQPVASSGSGNYYNSLALTFSSDNNDIIYYTVDGSDPDSGSTKYEDVINLAKGTTIVKAVACDSIGVYSDVLTLTYNIDYKQPDAPEIQPASGTYTVGSMVTIDNIKDGETAYYTTDGSTPTEKSTKYTGAFEMPEGNNIISAVIISEHNLTSAVTKRNYQINKVTEYTYDECLGMLKYKMIQRGDITSDYKNKSGKTVNFVYESRVKINDIDMYCVRCDAADVSSSYYGVGITNGNCYSIKINNGNYSATDY